MIEIIGTGLPQNEQWHLVPLSSTQFHLLPRNYSSMRKLYLWLLFIIGARVEFVGRPYKSNIPFVSASHFEDILWASYRGADAHSRTLYTPHLNILFDSQIADLTFGPWLSEMGFKLARRMHSFWLTEEEQVLMRAISTLAPGGCMYYFNRRDTVCTWGLLKSLPPVLAEEVMLLVPSICLRLKAERSQSWTDLPSILIFCMEVDLDPSYDETEGQGHRWKVKVKHGIVKVKRSKGKLKCQGH